MPPIQHDQQQTLQLLYQEYGEICAQLKIAQLRYMDCEKKLFPLLGLSTTPPPTQ